MKTEILERLSKAAPDWIKIEPIKVLTAPEFDRYIIRDSEGETLWTCPVETSGIDFFDQWMLFGAICEKANAKGWTLAVKFNADGSCVVDSIVKDGWEFRSKLAWEAAALALCEALEAKNECTNCNGVGGGTVDEWGDSEDWCPECDGTGKQKEVTNE